MFLIYSRRKTIDCYALLGRDGGDGSTCQSVVIEPAEYPLRTFLCSSSGLIAGALVCIRFGCFVGLCFLLHGHRLIY